MSRKIYLNQIIILGAILIGLNSCNHDKNSRGYDYFPDMKYSDIVKPYSSTGLNGGSSALQPVEGTIPRGYEPYLYPKTPEGLIKAGEELQNPLDSNDISIARGKKEFEIYCGICHGNDGKGSGILVTNEKYPVLTPSLVDEDMQARPEGELYHVITLGSAIMGAHGSQIRPLDRWAIILYIKDVLSLNKESDKPE